MKDVFDLVGRVCLSSLFLLQAATNFFRMPQTVVLVSAKGFEASTQFLFVLGSILLIMGSLLVLFGYRPKLGAGLLIVYLLPSAFAYHFDLENPQKQFILLQDIAVLGGLLMVMAHGSGKYSIRKLLASTKS